MAEQALKDALEELEVAPPTAVDAPTKRAAQQHIVINVTNVLSQATSVQVNQLLESLDSLQLSAAQRKEAEEHGKLLDQEAHGAQRWSVMARSLEVLKALGKPVYERVALPLLLDILKKQVGS